MRRDRIILSVVAASALVLGGCGGGGAPAASTGAAAGTDTTGTAPVVGNTTGGATDGTTGASTAGVGQSGDAPAAAIPDVKADDVPHLDGLAGQSDIFAPRAVVVDSNSSQTTSQTTSTTDTTSSSTTSTSSTSTSTPKVTVTYGPAVITLDGQSYTVDKGSVFPKDTGQFKLLSIGASSVTLQLTAGEFTSGAEGITLHTGKTISILNQSEGVSYVLTLESVKASSNSDSGSGTSF